MDIPQKNLLVGEIKRVFAQRVKDISDVRSIAEATYLVWQQLAAQIEPVIGCHGTQVLFNRALHILSQEFPWLAFSEHELNEKENHMATFKKHYAAVDIDLALTASETFLVTFSELLSSLIGESLTHQLLSPVLKTGITKESHQK